MRLEYPDQHPLVKMADNVSIFFILCGVGLFLYGLVVSDQTLQVAFLNTKASLFGGGVSAVPSTIIGTPHGVFITSALFITHGAVIDVWRRLRSM